MLEKIHVELTDEHMDAHGSAGGSYAFCTISVMMLRCNVSKVIHFRSEWSKILKNLGIQNPPKSQFFVRARALQY